MPDRVLDKNKLAKTEDWVDDTVAVICPVCGKVFITSKSQNPEGRRCPVCDKSVVQIDDNGETAKLYWE